MKKIIALIFIIVFFAVILLEIFIFDGKNQKDDITKEFSYDELSNMALDYFMKK